jgi:N-acetylglucosaminyldiphosphoundecaprenol N-acetyl-beta-D-mannosaminyltransferase
MSRQIRFKKYPILGIDVDAVKMEEAIKYIAEHSQKRSFYIVKPYVEFMDRATNDEKVKQLLNEAELCVADGVSLNWAAYFIYGGRRTFIRFIHSLVQILTKPAKLLTVLPDRFAGTNFTWKLLEYCRHKKLKIFLVGTPNGGSIEDTVTAINNRLKGIQIVGSHPGSLEGMRGKALYEALNIGSPEDELLDALNRTNPDIILIGMGFPLQELLMSKLSKRLSHGALVGEGGTFDYTEFGGHIKRAPNWMRRVGVEWIWRLMLEPRKRLKRQLAIPRFILSVWRNRHT